MTANIIFPKSIRGLAAAIPRAWHCNVRFPELIAKNLLGEENEPQIGAYEADMCMMKYSDEIVRKL